MLAGMPARRATEVVLEVADRKAFASAVDWPGWCRSGKTPEAALEALSSYAERYAVVAGLARVRFSTAAGDELTVVEQLPGDATTAFGAVSVVASTDRRDFTAAEADRQVRLLRAGWQELDRLAVEAPEELRKGPRGGGRDRDKMIDHVIAADHAYAREIGVRLPEPSLADRGAVDAERAAMLKVLRRPSDGSRLADRTAVESERAAILVVLRRPSNGSPLADRRWTQRYAARRIAWHALDHAWEMEDRSEPAP